MEAEKAPRLEHEKLHQKLWSFSSFALVREIRGFTYTCIHIHVHILNYLCVWVGGWLCVCVSEYSRTEQVNRGGSHWSGAGCGASRQGWAQREDVYE